MIVITKERLDDIRHSAEYDRDHLGAPGSTIRVRADATLELLDAYRERGELIEAIRALLPEEVVT